jgi:hypothetical protein
MASKRFKWILKVILISIILLCLKLLFEQPYSFNSVHLKLREIETKEQLTESSTNNQTADGTRTKGLENREYESTLKSKTHNSEELLSTNIEMIKNNIYGSDCPLNPYKRTLKHLFHYWMTLDNYYNFSSFLCRGSLIGLLRNGDLIPYDRDIDVCVTLENYHKVRAIRSQKPFDYQSSKIYLAVQEDFFNNNVSNRVRVDCRERIVQSARDPCSFETPGARLISRGVYVDVFVYREHGRNLRDHEYAKDHLKTDIFPLEYCTFMGVKTKCPRNKMSYLLKYYEPDVLTKPHYICRNKKWVASSQHVLTKFKIWFNKRLKLV